MELKRTVPFIARGLEDPEKRVLLLDNVEIHYALSDEVRAQIAHSLHLEAPHGMIAWEEAAKLVEEQYEACLEYMFSHPFWDELRSGQNTRAARGYLLENRHYLAAASFRMASGIPRAWMQSELADLVAHHVVEEDNHNVFFEKALTALGCEQSLIAGARPLPVTYEWIHVMRTVAARSPLCAALCSGLLEHTAKERAVVREWHEMLVERKILSAGTVNAIYEHVRTDMELGHGANWKKALEIQRRIPVIELAACLNSVTIVAESLVRWFDVIQRATAGLIVDAIRFSGLAAPDKRTSGWEVRGTPVWPAEIFDRVMYGSADGDAVDEVVCVAYGFSDMLDDCQDNIPTLIQARRLRDQLTDVPDATADPAGVDAAIHGWMRATSGHRLWQDMIEQPSYALTCGWLVENYHYISAIAQHTGAAIASCSDSGVRTLLVHHLREELDHGAILGKVLSCSRYGDIRTQRPLSTTTAFVGALCELARRDWRSYTLALVFLQRTLSTGDDASVHDEFYRMLCDQVPDAVPLIEAMRRHDHVDMELGHGDDVGALLDTLWAAGGAASAHVAAAALIPQLCWSFLDGIRDHYRHGDLAVMSRVGWTAE